MINNILFGRSGLRVSSLALGAMTFSETEGVGAAPPEARRIYEAYRTAGGNFIDTANIYTDGASERLLAEFIQADRDELVLASKYSMTTAMGRANCSGNHRKNLVQSLDASLRRLRTEYLDVLWVHGWDGVTRVDEVMRALDDQIRAGKVLHTGVSNCPAWYISQANTLAEERGWTPFTAVQVHYNLVERAIEADFFDLCRVQDMAITAWSPLAAGLLTAKYSPKAGQTAEADARLRRVEYGPAMLAPSRLAVADGLAAVADQLGCTPSQLALAWLLHRPQGCVIPILGARTLAQFMDNLGCLDIQLDSSRISELEALSPFSPVYPASLFSTDFYRRMIGRDTTGN